MNDTLKQYLQEVKRLLPCSSSEKKRFIMELEADVSAFLENHPNASLESLYASIGSPESIAESFMARITPRQLSRKLSVKRKIVIGVIATVAVLMIVLGSIAYNYADIWHDFFNGYDVETFGELPDSADPLPTVYTVN